MNICFMIWSQSSDSYYKPGDTMGSSFNTLPNSFFVKCWGHYGTAAETPWTVFFLNEKSCHWILCQVVRIPSSKSSKHNTNFWKQSSSPIRMKYWAPKSYSINEKYCNCNMIYSCSRLECLRILMQFCSVPCVLQGLWTGDVICDYFVVHSPTWWALLHKSCSSTVLNVLMHTDNQHRTLSRGWLGIGSRVHSLFLARSRWQWQKTQSVIMLLAQE